jgi:hypothetical protein
MSDKSDSIRIIKGVDRFKSASSVDYTINTELVQSQNQYTESDRTVALNLAQVFDDERQASSTFRPTFKIQYFYQNTYSGYSSYSVYRDSLSYVNAITSLENNDGFWYGYPQYVEFDFFRKDVTNPQVNFVPKSATSYNWTYYYSYPFSNDSSVPMSYTSPSGVTLNVWNSGDGIPFEIVNGSDNGFNIISFKCPVKHGLLISEYVQLNLSYNGNNLFQIYSLGDGSDGSSEFVFNVANVGYTGGTFGNGVTGIFKRIVNIQNSGETMSKYYVRVHKIITNIDEMSLTKTGFEQTPFSDRRVYQYSALTPNNQARISQRQSNNVYNLTCERDIDINGLVDGNKKPIGELYLTFVNKGYYGWFNRFGLKKGWEFNITPTTNQWWAYGNNLSNENVTTSNYVKTDGENEYVFYYVNNLVSGDTIYGDWCEYNESDQTERVVSKYYHKMTFNGNVFNINATDALNPDGYYYQVHFPMQIREYSEYVEEGSTQDVSGVPNYATYSENKQIWRWKDLYTYGFIDDKGRGVDYPFINDSHYPYKNVFFKLIPEGALLSGLNYTLITQPIIDECE